jgi:hypothetical protein
VDCTIRSLPRAARGRDFAALYNKDRPSGFDELIVDIRKIGFGAQQLRHPRGAVGVDDIISLSPAVAADPRDVEGRSDDFVLPEIVERSAMMKSAQRRGISPRQVIREL